MIELLDDPDAFLAVAEEHLRKHAVVSTVLSTATLQDVRDRAAGVPLPEGRPRWWAVARDEVGTVAGCAFRSPTGFPPYLLPMPDADAADLARLLHERGEDVRGASGATRSCEVFGAAWGELTGDQPRVLVRSQLFELSDLVPPTGVPGHLRAATEDDVDVLADHLAGFQHDAEAQAGRDPGERPHDEIDRDTIVRRIRQGEFSLWVTDGRTVSSVGARGATYGVARVGPVYTPPAHRGHGYAAAATAAVSERLLAEGARPCLFTDLANPTSNGVYARLGYRPVVDAVEMTFTSHTDWAHGLA